jgi:putative tricarboxylic transport membrane protein
VKINDAITGALLIALGAVILWHIQGFPAMQGQKYGPAWFPGIIAVGLAACGAALVVQGARSADAWVAFSAWTRQRRALAGFFSVIAGLLFYVLAAGPVGFHITAFAMLLAGMRILGTRLAVALPVAVLAPILIHLAFYKMLRVPLPWGVLERFAF